MLPAARALLLDFGGVIVESSPGEAETLPPLVARIHQLINGLLTEEEIAEELGRADEQRSALRYPSGQEMGHEQLWGLVAELWPDDAKEAVLREAAQLSYLWASRRSWHLNEGIAELLDYTLGAGIPVAVVSNTRCGQAHRDALDRFGVTGAFAVQIYSDELGYCKPHPEMIWATLRELDFRAADCWFVGDQPAKDIVCARRAGVGAAILMGPKEYTDSDSPDATVADGHELLRLLRALQ